jgi:signal transduction histidine kinase
MNTPFTVAGARPAQAARRVLTIRTVIIVGFAIVFGLWVLSSYELVRRMGELERLSASEREAALRVERVLSVVRTNVLLGSIYLRDALIDRGASLDAYRAELNEARTAVEAVLPGYLVEVTSASERTLWNELNTELTRYWKSRELVFAPESAFDTADEAAALRSQVVPSRETVLQIIDRLAALQSLAEQRHEQDVARLSAELRSRLLSMSAVTIVLGLVVAIVAIRHSGRLERHIESRRLAEHDTRLELERLSARLVNVQEEERRHLARELHDEVGQALTAIKLDVGVALRTLEGDTRARTALEDARNLAETTLQGVRDLSQLLHPSMLDDFGLPETLKHYLRGFSQRTGVQTHLIQKRMEHRLAPEVEAAAYRIVQEALTNVARHSGSRNATVALVRQDAFLHVIVDDDGCGIGERAGNASPQTAGLGLIGMRERAQSLGGTCTVSQRAEGGTQVSLWLPASPAGVSQELPVHSNLLAG